MKLPLFPVEDSEPILSAPAGHARGIAWLDGVLEWLTNEAAYGGKSCGSLPNSVPAGFLAKTFPAFCRSMEGGILAPSSVRWQNWGMGSPTAFLTLSGSEFPSGAVACSLSDILETGDVPPKYFLSAKACRGILRRAEKRGRELPPALHGALTAVAGADTPDGDGRTT